MCAQRLQDLIVWQLSQELRTSIIAVSGQGGLQRDLKLRDQMRSAGSVAANIAEGFGRFRPKDHARFLRTARASVFELREHLTDASSRGYLTGHEHNGLDLTCRRISIGLLRLIQYLEHADPPTGR
jgi:four helix bundle protein